jgi:hypothetical protein
MKREARRSLVIERGFSRSAEPEGKLGKGFSRMKADPVRNADGFRGGFNVVYADDVGAFEDCGGNDRHGAVEAV